MNNITKSYQNSEGVKETVIASSEDDCQLNIADNYKLANHKQKKENRALRKFKSSMFGTDIGIKSAGFSSVAILATVLALAVMAALYFLWRF